MSTAITRVELRYEQDVVYARYRARIIAEMLGFDKNDQTRISTAVSEIARNAYQYADGGEIEFFIDTSMEPNVFAITVRDRGKGISRLDEVLEGRFESKTGMGLGIIGSRRLMDHFHIDTQPEKGTTVFLGKTLPATAPKVTPALLTHITDVLVKTAPQSPFEEIQLQNQDLIRALEELRQQKEELININRELEDTNRGVLALYAELDEKALQLQGADTLKSRYLSEMSHEFRTPLNSISSLSRILLDKEDGNISPEQEKQVTFIRKAAENLSDLVNDLLDIAKIEAGKVTITPAEFTVNELFSTLRGMLRPLLANPDVKLIFEDAEGIPPMDTDQGKVSQVLRNLVSNSIKFTDRGEIRVSAASSPELSSVIFSVTDTGIGIAPADQPRLFQEFVQLDNTGKTTKKGSGLGLSIAKRLAGLLGGTLVLTRSVPDEGSTFTSTIPVRFSGKTADIIIPAHAKKTDPLRYPVLVIEDDKNMVTVYEKYLRNTGFQLIWAPTIKVARELLKETRFVAIILDILLPGEDAWGFLAELKNGKSKINIPVIAATIVEEKEKGLMLGADDYWVKPVDRKKLLAKLREISQKTEGGRILIIDDDEISRYLIKGMIGDTRFSLLEADNGAKGLTLAAQEHPDLILLDLIMPGMSGFAVLNELRSDPATRNIPVIIITSKTLSEEERKELAQGAAAILSKDTSSRDLALATIRETLKQATGIFGPPTPVPVAGWGDSGKDEHETSKKPRDGNAEGRKT